MLPECPHDLTFILPYLQRASELRQREPIISYYCGFYAANLVLTKGYSKTAENDNFLAALFDALEQQKKEIPRIEKEESRKYILQFALKIFLSADNQDRTNEATKKTARLFLVSSQFLEIARVFGDLPEEIEEKILYAKWKASDIVNSLNRGDAHSAGSSEKQSPGDENANESAALGNQTLLPPESPETAAFPSLQQNQNNNDEQSRFTEGEPTTARLPSFSGNYSSMTQTSSSTDNTKKRPSATQLGSLTDAEKHARWAVSAIQFEDVQTAIKELKKSLEILEGVHE